MPLVNSLCYIILKTISYENRKSKHAIFGTSEEARVAPKYEMPKTSMPGEVAYQIVHDEAMLDGNSRLNLATFVSTWMDDYARRVMTENMDKNMIDKTEYPQTAEIERRCVNIIAKLWNSPEKPYCTGTSTVGSSEACMLGGIAALKRWQKRRKAKGLLSINRISLSQLVCRSYGRNLLSIGTWKCVWYRLRWIRSHLTRRRL